MIFYKKGNTYAANYKNALLGINSPSIHFDAIFRLGYFKKPSIKKLPFGVLKYHFD